MYSIPGDPSIPFGIFWFVAWIGWVIGAAFCVFSFACGLFYLAELAEEHSVATRRLLRSISITLIIVHLLLAATEDQLCWYNNCLGALANIVYFTALRPQRIVLPTCPWFLASAAMFLVVNVLWILEFTQQFMFPFWAASAFFLLCVWLVPIGLFLTVLFDEGSLPMSK